MWQMFCKYSVFKLEFQKPIAFLWHQLLIYFTKNIAEELHKFQLQLSPQPQPWQSRVLGK